MHQLYLLYVLSLFLTILPEIVSVFKITFSIKYPTEITLLISTGIFAFLLICVGCHKNKFYLYFYFLILIKHIL